MAPNTVEQRKKQKCKSNRNLGHRSENSRGKIVTDRKIDSPCECKNNEGIVWNK